MAGPTIVKQLLTALFAGCITSIQPTEPVVDREQSGSSSAELIANVPGCLRQSESSPMELVGNVLLAVPSQSRTVPTDLPIDVMLDIFSHLSIKDLIAARISCRAFDSLISADPFLVDHSILKDSGLSVISQIPDVMSRMAADYRRCGTVRAVHLRKQHTYRAITQFCTEDGMVGDAAQVLPDANRIIPQHCSINKLMEMSAFITTFLPDHGQVVVGELIMRQMLREIVISNGIVGPTAETFAHLPRSTKVAVISSVEESITRAIISHDVLLLFDILMFLESCVDGPPIPAPTWTRLQHEAMMFATINGLQPQLVRLVAQLGGSCRPTHKRSFLHHACKSGSPDVVRALLEATESPQQLIWTPSSMGRSILFSLGNTNIPEDSKVAIAEIILTFCKKPRDLILAVKIKSIEANDDSPDPDHFVYKMWPSKGLTPMHVAVTFEQSRLLELYLTKLHNVDPETLTRFRLLKKLSKLAKSMEQKRLPRSGTTNVLEKFSMIML